MNQYTMLNFVLANKKKKELEDQGITVPSDFMTKSLIYGMIAPNMPMLGFMMLDKEAKKLVSEKAISDAHVKDALGTETGNPPKPEDIVYGTETGNPDPLPPIINITAVNRQGNKLNRVRFISLSGKIDEDFGNIINEKSIDTAVTNENGIANLFYPKEGAVTIISYVNERLSKLQFEAGKVPKHLEFLIEDIPEKIEQTAEATDAISGSIKNQKADSVTKKSNIIK